MTTNHDDFSTTLGNALISNLPNWYGAENWDSEVLPYKESLADWIFTRIQRFSRSLLKNLVLLRKADFLHLANGFNALGTSIHELSTLYHRLEDDQSRSLLISLLAYRLMGYRKVMLPVNSPAYWEMRKVASSLEKSKSAIKLKFRNWVLNHQDLHKIGYPLEVYLMPVWVATTFMLKQYEYSNSTTIKAQEGDSVIDAGGGWGDTALYFAHEVGAHGRVYTFEFESENLDIIHKNVALNPELSNRIKLIQKVLWDKSGEELKYSINGPATKLTNSQNDSFQASTLSIDDFVANDGLTKVDFIKMDIEGSELRALRGAERTIRTFGPKLAISVYHNPDDLTTISNYIADLGLGYEFFLGHFTIYRGETILFARIRNNS